MPALTEQGSGQRQVLHIVAGLDFGGVESHMRIIAKAHSRYCHHFCAIGQGGAALAAITAGGGLAEALNRDGWKRPLATIAALARTIRRVSPEIVHTHGAEGNLFGLPAAWLARAPVRIGEEIGMPEHSLKARLATRAAYRTAHRVVAISDAVRQAIVANREAAASKVVRIYNPVDLPGVRAHKRRLGQPLRIGFVGRLEPVKNALGLVRAIALLPDRSEYSLVIIGDGSEMNDLRAQVTAEGLGDRVTLAGFLDQPAEALTQCHFYLQPSLAEGFGIALIEAMACGLPVAASRIGGMPELVEEGVTGWLLESPSDRHIAQAIERAAALDPAELAAMGEAARRSVEGRFDAPVYMRRIEALYDDCLKEVGRA